MKKMNWNEANEYVKQLNIAGHTDWRLPSVNELVTLFDYASGKPVIKAQCAGYWSSITYANVSNCARIVVMNDGYVGACGKDGYYYVWPVRGGQFDSHGNLIVTGLKERQARITRNGDGTLTDNLTGLMWMEEEK